MDGLKYDLVVAPGVDPGIIRMRYEGQDGLALREGALKVTTSIGVITEGAPVSWNQLTAGLENRHMPVRSAYRLRGNIVSFDVAA